MSDSDLHNWIDAVDGDTAFVTAGKSPIEDTSTVEKFDAGYPENIDEQIHGYLAGVRSAMDTALVAEQKQLIKDDMLQKGHEDNDVTDALAEAAALIEPDDPEEIADALEFLRKNPNPPKEDLQ